MYIHVCVHDFLENTCGNLYMQKSEKETLSDAMRTEKSHVQQEEHYLRYLSSNSDSGRVIQQNLQA